MPKPAIIHFMAKHPSGPLTGQGGIKYVIACTPSATTLPRHASGEHTAVTCPLCKQTQIYIDADSEPAGHPADVAALKAIREAEAANDPSVVKDDSDIVLAFAASAENDTCEPCEAGLT